MIKSIIKSICNKIGFSQMHLPFGLLCVNFIFQRIFRINGEIKSSVHYTSRIDGFKNLIIHGDARSVLTSMAVSGGCYFTVFEGTKLEIGEGTIWSFNVCIQTGNHDYFDRDKYIIKDIKIGKNCWISHAVTIVAGVEIGDNVIVGANSVVTKSFPNNVVIGGCPAKIIKELVK